MPLKILIRGCVAFLIFTTAASAEFIMPRFPPDQPKQIHTGVSYNEHLDDPFFHKEVWSHPWWFIKHPDGTFENTRGGSTNPKEIPKLKHTARCTSTAQYEHAVKFADVRQEHDDSLTIYLHDDSASTADYLMIKISHGKFTSQYWTFYPADQGNERLIWTTTRQQLTLDKKDYKKGDTIKGRVMVEIFQEILNPKYDDQEKRSIKLSGVFKTVVQ